MKNTVIKTLTWLPNAIKVIVDEFPRQALHSSRINFKHPITEDLIDIESHKNWCKERIVIRNVR